MFSFSSVVLLVGVGLLALGGASAIALFSRALKSTPTTGNETNVGTLWGLFLLGLVMGLVLIYFALRAQSSTAANMSWLPNSTTKSYSIIA